jgi:hypothetical protein
MHKTRRRRRPLGLATTIVMAAMLLTGCAAGSAGNPSTLRGQTTAAGNPPEYADADLIVEQVVRAGGSIDVPLTFEGSSFGTIQVVSSALVTATYGVTALDGTATPTYTAITTAMSNPSDGPVHVVNQGTTDATVTVIAKVGTTRHLIVMPPSSAVAKGGTGHFDAVVSEAIDADGASAYLQDSSGVQTPVALTKVGTGHWTGQVSPTVSGVYEIHVQTSGARVRYGIAGVSVSKGNVTFGSGFTEQLLDTDQDGLANQLVLTASVTALNPGNYSVNADLIDAKGTAVTNGGGEVSLVAGTQSLAIKFDGASIYKSGLSGPYHLINVTLTDESNYLLTEAVSGDLGATQAYDYHSFQH